jgi:hypothetical protein
VPLPQLTAVDTNFNHGCDGFVQRPVAKAVGLDSKLTPSTTELGAFCAQAALFATIPAPAAKATLEVNSLLDTRLIITPPFNDAPFQGLCTLSM